MDRDWWSKLPEFDWAVAVTQGVGKTVDWVLEPSYELAKEGLVILDRLTFLEPTRDRSDFLTSKPFIESDHFESATEISCGPNKIKRLCNFCVVCV